MPDLSHSGPTKADMRAELLGRRRSLPAATLADAADRVTASVAALVRASAPRLVCGYVPMGSEPGGADLPAALRVALTDEAELLLPVLRPDNDLDWAAYDGMLVPAPRGLREPPGERLGRGGGSYDRALARARAGVRVVALLHDGELVDRLPDAAHDQHVTGVITPADGLVWL